MLECILLALILSKLKGYKLKYILTEKVFYPLLLCEVFYWGVQISLFAEHYGFLKYAGTFKTIYLCTTLFIVFRYELYQYAIVGAGFVLLGGWCNDLAIGANGGFMPVYPTLSYLTGYIKPEAFGVADQLHVIGNEMTKMKYLTDIFDVGYSVLSIGDIFIRVLPCIVLYQGIKKVNMQSIEE